MTINIQYVVNRIVSFLSASSRTYLSDGISLYEYQDDNLVRKLFSADFSEVCYQDGYVSIKTFESDVLLIDEESWIKHPSKEKNLSEYLGDLGVWSISVTDLGVGESCLVAKNRNDLSEIAKNGNFRGIRFSEFSIILRDGKDLIAIDDSIEEVWRVPVFEGRKLAGFSYGLQTSHSLVFLNQGIDRKTRSGCITARSMSDGSEVWSYSYEEMPEYAFIHKALYYVIESGVIAILNPENGEVTSKVDLGLEENIVLEPIGNHFVIASNKTKKLHLFDIDTHALKEVMSLPKGFCFRGAQFNLSESHLFVELQSDNPAFGYCTKALLTIPMVKGFPDFEEDIRVENRLSMPMMLTEGPDGERVYLFTVSCDSLDDLIRLGSIEIFEFACAYGEPVIGPHMNPDVKHKGKVKVVVDSEVLPEGCEETVKEWGKNLSYCLEKSAVFPGAGDQYRFDVQVELR